MTKKQVIITSITLIVILILGWVFYYFFLNQDEKSTLTIVEKKWIEKNKNNDKMNIKKDLEIALQTLLETKDRLNDDVHNLDNILKYIRSLDNGVLVGKLLSSLQINLIDLDDNINEVKKYVGED